MTRTLIFDLSDVLIPGLNGIEAPLATRLCVPPDTILPAFRGFLLDTLCCGLISEEAYLRLVCEQKGWNLDHGELKQIIRHNFRRRVPGMQTMLLALAQRYELVLLSDHGAEWVAAIHGYHPWLDVFGAQFFSYELRLTKRDPRTFRQVLRKVRQTEGDCVVVDHNEANLRTAAAAGLRAIRFTSAEQLANELTRHGL